jgi:hypothetical protein
MNYNCDEFRYIKTSYYIKDIGDFQSIILIFQTFSIKLLRRRNHEKSLQKQIFLTINRF